MDWTTIPIELLERILILTESLNAIVNACMTCKTWNGVGADSHLWKALYHVLSKFRISNEPNEVDWKAKVIDLAQIQTNIKNGRCVVRTLATSERPHEIVSLGFDNISNYKDMCLVNWMNSEFYGSRNGIERNGSDLINMVTGKIKKMNWLNETVFLNNYVAHTESSYYGVAMFKNIKVLHFDSEDLASIVFDNYNGVKLKLSEHRRYPIKNYCTDSNYIGFMNGSYLSKTSFCTIVNGENGEVVFRRIFDKDMDLKCFRMYDCYLVINTLKNSLIVVDIATKEEIEREFKSPVELGFMTHNEVALHTGGQILLWNFLEETEVSYPAGEVPLRPIELVYYDMWVVTYDGNIRFYNVKDGSFMNALGLRQQPILNIQQLSDGRLAILQQIGCRVLSLVDCEVNRKVKIIVMDCNGEVEEHEIAAFELCNFFVDKVGQLNYMSSRVIKYTARELQPKERFAMIFSHEFTEPINEPATKLLETAVEPTCVNTPYQGWTIDEKPISSNDSFIDTVHGNALIVREKKVDGRWQLVSM